MVPKSIKNLSEISTTFWINFGSILDSFGLHSGGQDAAMLAKEPSKNKQKTTQKNTRNISCGLLGLGGGGP